MIRARISDVPRNKWPPTPACPEAKGVMGIPKQWMVAVVPMLAVLALNEVPGNSEPALAGAGLSRLQESVSPQKGVFLVASSDMTDPRFHQSVVLLLAHAVDGTMGLIINRASEIPLSEVLPELEGSGVPSQVLFFGGPVGLNGLLFLIHSDTPPGQASEVMDDVYFSGDPTLLEELLDEGRDSHDLRVYVGRAGWAPGQLADEIARGSWGLVPGDPQTIFEKDLEHIWRDLSGPPEIPRFIVQRGVESSRSARFVSLFAYTWSWIVENMGDLGRSGK